MKQKRTRRSGIRSFHSNYPQSVFNRVPIIDCGSNPDYHLRFKDAKIVSIDEVLAGLDNGSFKFKLVQNTRLAHQIIQNTLKEQNEI